MANSMPWSVRGIDPDIREQAVEAAHRSGLSVGQWLNQVLAGSLDEDEVIEEAAVARRPRTSRRAPGRHAELSERLSRLTRPRTETAAHRFADSADESPVLDLLQEAVEAIERIERRQTTHPQSPVPAPASMAAPADAKSAALAEQLRSFDARLDQLLRQRAEEAETPRRGPTKALEERLAGIMATLDRMQAQIAVPVIAQADRAAARLADEDPAFARTLAEIEARRRALDAGAAPRPAQGRSEPQAPAAQDRALEAMRADLAKLANRIDDLRAPSDSSLEVAAVRRELAQVSATLEQISPQRLVGMVEHAVSGLADRMTRAPHAGLPDTLSEPLERLHEDVRAVLREVSTARGTEALSREVGNIARRLDTISTASSPDQIEQIAAETTAIKQLVSQALRSQPLEGLAHQIEMLAREVQRSQANPAARDDRALLDAIRDVSDRLERLDPQASFAALESRLGAISSLEHRLSAVAGIEEKLGAIALGMENLAKKSHPLPKLDKITERLERIDRALDNPKASPLAGLDELTQRLDRIGSTLDKVSVPAKGNDDALLGLMENLSHRMEQLAGTQGDSRALDQLQAEIATLARRLEGAGTAPAGLDSIERAVSDLFAQIDQNRSDMRELAESAATRAAEQAVRAGGETRSGETESLAAEGLLLLKRDLSDFKSAQSAAETRTRETLQDVQKTLGLMMARLGETEQNLMRAPAMPAPAAAPARSAPQPHVSAPQVSATLDSPASSPALGMPARAEAPAARKPAFERSEPTSPDAFDLPLEPGMEPGASRPAASVAGNAATLDPVLPADPRANFIAAARRAAQAAAEKSQAALAEEADKGKPGKGNLRAMAAKGSPTLSLVAKARKPILLGLAAIVFSMGALKVINSRHQTGLIAPKAPEAHKLDPLGPDSATPKAGEPETTGSVPQRAPERSSDAQMIPGVSAPSIGDANFNTKLNKRGQRLSDSTAFSQSDPATVGSLGREGGSQPISTTQAALGELAAKVNFKGLESLRDAALSGNPAALFDVGSRLADGRGMTRDPQAAMRWFEQAAAAGHGPSQYRLASLYREGRGITKDSSLAFQWFDRAAAQGHVLAMHNAAVLLAEGVHGAPDYAGAALWFKRAAEHGVKDSQFNVAILFARGLGVNQDLGEAYRWFAIAANQGDVDAGKKRDDMGQRLSKEQLNAENEKVKTFRPMKANPAANEPGMWEAVAKRV